MEDKKFSSTNILQAFVWKFLERGGTQLIQFIVQILLARILSPSEFGINSILLVFINVGQVFIQSGFNTALVQEKSVDNDTYSSVFNLSLFIAVFLYLLMFIFAPSIANFYNNETLIQTLRLMALALLPGPLLTVQNAIISRKLNYSLLFKVNFFSSIIAGFIAILMALNNFGVWALVVQYLINQYLQAIILWFEIKWRPTFTFSYRKTKKIVSYGWKILVSNLVNNLNFNIRTLVIGRYYSAADLGYYNRGAQFPLTIVQNVNLIVQSVLFPVMSVEQDNINSVKIMMRKTIQATSLFIIPLMAGLVVISDPLVRLILTDKWLPAVPYIQIFCISYAINPILNAGTMAINSIGKSGLVLILELSKLIISIVILFISLPYGLINVAIGLMLGQYISFIIQAIVLNRIFYYDYLTQLKDFIPTLVVSVVMAIIVNQVTFNNISILLNLVLKIIVGLIVYIILSFIFNKDNINILSPLLKKNRRRF